MDPFGDTINHLAKSVDDVLAARIAQVDKMIDDKLVAFRELLNGVTITNSVKVTEVRPAEIPPGKEA